MKLDRVKDTVEKFCRQVGEMFGNDLNEEVIKLIDTNWLAVTGTLMKLQSLCTARRKLGLNTLVLVYYTGHAISASDSL